MEGFVFTVSTTVSLRHSLQSFTQKHARTCAYKHVPSLRDIIPSFPDVMVSTVRFRNLLVGVRKDLHWSLWRLGVWQEYLYTVPIASGACLLKLP